jgi:hypothetical protein
MKGARDITSGVVLLVVWASAGSVTLGWALVAAAITPTEQLRRGGHLELIMTPCGAATGEPSRVR